MAGIARLMTTLANVLPGIERSVMPRWLEHVMASPLRFQNGRIVPLRQSSGICSVDQTWLKMLVSHVTTASPPLFISSAVMLHMPMHARSLIDLAPSEHLQALCHLLCKEGSHLDGWLGLSTLL